MGKKDIKYDQHNYRDHDDRNLSLIKKSIQRCGAGRSILLDKNGEIIAGNATYKTLQELIKKFKLDRPIYAKLCREGLFSGI